MAAVALTLAGGDHADFVSPSVAVGTLQLNPLGPGVGGDAAVIGGAASPPFSADDGVGEEVGGHALARANQLPDRLGTSAGSVCDVTRGTQFSAAQLRGTWGGGGKGESRVTVEDSLPCIRFPPT